jgi:hypothetical protein
MSTNNKRNMEAPEDDDEYDEDYEDGSSLHDTLLRRVEIVKISCKANKMSDKEQLQLGWQGG